MNPAAHPAPRSAEHVPRQFVLPALQARFPPQAIVVAAPVPSQEVISVDPVHACVAVQQCVLQSPDWHCPFAEQDAPSGPSMQTPAPLQVSGAAHPAED
jgi:hypothetical protein